MIPQNPVMLLSFVNTKLRDEFDSLEAFCDYYDVSQEEIEEKLKQIDYYYQKNINQFK
jgi:hypothetical protein